jgi:GH24 family phage-related lysozyme (muramidase)
MTFKKKTGFKDTLFNVGEVETVQSKIIRFIWIGGKSGELNQKQKWKWTRNGSVFDQPMTQRKIWLGMIARERGWKYLNDVNFCLHR